MSRPTESSFSALIQTVLKGANKKGKGFKGSKGKLFIYINIYLNIYVLFKDCKSV